MTPELPSNTLTMAKMSKSKMTVPTRLRVVGSISALLCEIEFFESFPILRKVPSCRRCFGHPGFIVDPNSRWLDLRVVLGIQPRLLQRRRHISQTGNDVAAYPRRRKLKGYPLNRRPSVIQNSPQITGFGIIVDPIPPKNSTMAAIT